VPTDSRPPSQFAERLARETPEPVRALCRTLSEAGFEGWLVGGCVRDTILNELHRHQSRPRNDWDIATDARPKQVMKLFSHVVPTGIQHGTVTVVLNGQGYEVTTFRAEAEYSDGRRPDSVGFVDDITADLSRRDFTVNAIAYDPVRQTFVDPFRGLDDLQGELLRAVGEPAQRFGEDGLRVARAARFVATLEFELESETEAAIRPSLSSYRKVSAERIRDEWQKSMSAGRPSLAFRVMHRHGLLEITAPDLWQLAEVPSERGAQASSVWEYLLDCVDACPNDSRLRFAALLHGLGWPAWCAAPGTEPIAAAQSAQLADVLMDELRFSNAERREIGALIRHHSLNLDSEFSDADLRRWLIAIGPPLCRKAFQLSRARLSALGAASLIEQVERFDQRCQRLLDAGFPRAPRELAIKGHELMQMGVPKGPELGRILAQLWQATLEDPALNTPAALTERALDLAGKALG